MVRLWRLPCACTCSSAKTIVRGGSAAAAVLLVVFGLGCGHKAPQEGAQGASAEAPPAAAPDTGAVPSNVVTGDDPRLDDITFLRSQPRSEELEIALGSYFLRRDQNDSALVHYRTATTFDAKSPRPWNFVGITLSRMDSLDAAVHAYETAIKLDPFYSKTHVNLGNTLLKKGDLDKAINAYTVATRVDSTDFLAWLDLGLAWERKTGKRTGSVSSPSDQEAIKAYMKATKCDDTRPEPWERLGWIYFDQKYYKPARERWEEAVKRDPSRTDLQENIRRLEAYAESTGTP